MSAAEDSIQRWLRQLAGGDRPLVFMEVCGTHTMAAARCGLRSMLPAHIRLVSGPGCPVCVSPVGYMDHALALAGLPDVTIATFGDLIRVPGSRPSGGEVAPSLQHSRARGADVRVVYSPMDALTLAIREPERQVVFLGVGFETTTPTIAATIRRARQQKVPNFTVLGAHKTIPEAMHVLATTGELGIDGFLCPGHVSIIIGTQAYEPLVRDAGVPCAIAGFEPEEMLRGLASLQRQALDGRPEVDNCYPGAVREQGNPTARAVMNEVFEPSDSNWRGIGTIEHSGLTIRPEFSGFDAAERFDVQLPPPVEPKGCRCGDVLRGVIEPAECPLFGRGCTPESPQGACMVSSEGSCAARFQYDQGDWT